MNREGGPKQFTCALGFETKRNRAFLLVNLAKDRAVRREAVCDGGLLGGNTYDCWLLPG